MMANTSTLRTLAFACTVLAATTSSVRRGRVETVDDRKPHEEETWGGRGAFLSATAFAADETEGIRAGNRDVGVLNLRGRESATSK